MINFVFDTWETSAPSENQRNKYFRKKYVGTTQFSDVGPTLAKRRCANVVVPVVPTATMPTVATLRQRSTLCYLGYSLSMNKSPGFWFLVSEIPPLDRRTTQWV